jgi:hypothetical protein
LYGDFYYSWTCIGAVNNNCPSTPGQCPDGYENPNPGGMSAGYAYRHYIWSCGYTQCTSGYVPTCC